MLTSWAFWLRLTGFWMLFFIVFRLWLLLMYTDHWPEAAPHSVWNAFVYAIPLDFSTLGYLTAAPLLIWLIGAVLPPNGQKRIEQAIKLYHFILLPALILVFGANVFLYGEWETPLNRRAIDYLKTPAALFNSMSPALLVLCILLTALFCLVWYKFYQKIASKGLYDTTRRWPQTISWPLWAGLCALAIRGGTGPMPINESVVYRSQHLFVNHAATNTLWHLVHVLVESRSTDNPYQFTGSAAAQASTDSLLVYQPSPPAQVLRDTQPNIVLVIMESMTAQVVGAIGGEPGVTPNLDRLISEGLVFEQCYSSGYRTDQGFAAILSGYPAQPDQSVVLLEDKANQLPSLFGVLSKAGYSTFYSAGIGLNFGNFGVWLRNQGAEKVISIDDFPRVERTQNWGVDDYLLFNRLNTELNALRQPFFAVGQTQSLHLPYDTPAWFKSNWGGSKAEPDLFRHAAAFADHSIGHFIEQARQQPWFQNTLFVFVADHGHALPSGAGPDNPVSRRVPLICWGPALRPEWTGRRIAALGGHHDLPATLMGMLHRSSPFRWSSNLLDTRRRPFAYYSNESSMGWVTPRGQGTYYFQSKNWHQWQGTLSEQEKKQGLCYLQALYDNFLGL